MLQAPRSPSVDVLRQLHPMSKWPIRENWNPILIKAGEDLKHLQEWAQA